MSSKIYETYELDPGKSYNLIFREFGGKIKFKETLGKLVYISIGGRLYDREMYMRFINEEGVEYYFDPPYQSSYGYIQYSDEKEEDIKKRIQERTRILQDDILGNDWALRPENVVATQGIDLSLFRREP